MAHALWKGHITFGLVTIPVGLHTAEKREQLDLTLLDKHDLSPIGYRKVNKNTGKEVDPKDIVKGYEYGDDSYVVLTEADFKKANVEATQTIEIVAFVELTQIDPALFDKPYYLAPQPKAERAYRLLAETLEKTGRVGVAKVVIRTRQYLSILMSRGPVLVLEILRFADELRQPADVGIDEDALAKLEVNTKELNLAKRLVDEMTAKWKPEQYQDDYRKDLLELIEQKVKSKGGPVKGKPAPKKKAGAGKVIDLMEVLKRSVEQTGQKPKERRRRKGA